MNRVEKTSESTVVERFRNADQAFMKICYIENYGLVENLVTKNSGSQEDAKDLYQEVFMVFVEQTHKPNFVLSCKLGTYLYSVAHRQWLKKLKKRNKSTVVLEKEHIENIGIEIAEAFPNEWNQEELLVKDWVDALGDPCKTILVSYYYETKSMQDITEIMNYPNSKRTKSQKYKCMERLRKKYKEISKIA